MSAETDQHSVLHDLELFHFAFRNLIEEPDRLLASFGLNRSHHRVLYFIARAAEGITITDLLERLAVTRQALHRPLRQLLDQGMVVMTPQPDNRRITVVALTDAGRDLEHGLSTRQVEMLERAFVRAGSGSAAIWRAVMAELARDPHTITAGSELALRSSQPRAARRGKS